MLQLLEKFVQLGQQDDSDDEFEDEEVEEVGQQEDVDYNSLQSLAWTLLSTPQTDGQTWADAIIRNAVSIPQFANVPSLAVDAMDEI